MIFQKNITNAVVIASINMHSRLFLIPPLLAMFAGVRSEGATFVHESFTGYSVGLMRGQAATGSGLSGVYGGNGNAAVEDPPTAASGSFATGTFVSSGLTFGDYLPTSGGAMTIASGTTVVGVKVAPTTPSYSGTLWVSFLVRFNAAHNSSATGNPGVELRLTTGSASDAGNAKFRTYADSRVDGNTAIGVDYNSSDFASVGSSPAVLANGTTYIMISSFTNVGASIGGGGVATTWAMTQSQYEAMMTSPLGPEAYLLAATAGQYFGMATATDAEKASDVFDNSIFLQMVSVSNNVTYDEIRLGSSLVDVVPEPGTALLGILGASVAWVRRRRI